MAQPIEPPRSPDILPPNINDYIKNKTLVRLKREDLEDSNGSSIQNKNEYVTGTVRKIRNEIVFIDNASPKYYNIITNLQNITPVTPNDKSDFLFPYKPGESEPSGGYKRKKSKKLKKSKKCKKSKTSKKKKC